MSAIYIGLDDTDVIGTPGTNQLARKIAGALPPGYSLTVALRHQLWLDRRVPYTSKNGCASLLVRAGPEGGTSDLVHVVRREMQVHAVPGSDPGFCVAERVPPDIAVFGSRCQRELVRQSEARALAQAHGLHLEGLGGTEDGVIGALAAAGLLSGGDDGRVIHRAGWPWPDAFSGPQPIRAVLERGVDEVRVLDSNEIVRIGTVDIGKRLRPSYRGGRVILFVEPATDNGWRALRVA